MTTRRIQGTPIAGFEALIALLRFDAQGLMPTIIQDRKSREVLTLCYLTREALERSLSEGLVYVFRRSLRLLMLKGQTSGHVQVIRQVAVDCEGKSLLMVVDQRIAGCHAGYFSCYYRRLGKDGAVVITGRRLFDPSTVYKKTT